jgi:hypothetical protein
MCRSNTPGSTTTSSRPTMRWASPSPSTQRFCWTAPASPCGTGRSSGTSSGSEEQPVLTRVKRHYRRVRRGYQHQPHHDQPEPGLRLQQKRRSEGQRRRRLPQFLRRHGVSDSNQDRRQHHGRTQPQRLSTSLRRRHLERVETDRDRLSHPNNVVAARAPKATARGGDIANQAFPDPPVELALVG